MKQISIKAHDVRETNTFKGASQIQQSVLTNSSNIKTIENGVNVSSNIGFDKWKLQTNSSALMAGVVQELTSKI